MIVDHCELCCIFFSHGELFGVMNNSIVIGDGFYGWFKNFDGSEEFTVL